MNERDVVPDHEWRNDAQWVRFHVGNRAEVAWKGGSNIVIKDDSHRLRLLAFDAMSGREDGVFGDQGTAAEAFDIARAEGAWSHLNDGYRKLSDQISVGHDFPAQDLVLSISHRGEAGDAGDERYELKLFHEETPVALGVTLPDAMRQALGVPTLLRSKGTGYLLTSKAWALG